MSAKNSRPAGNGAAKGSGEDLPPTVPATANTATVPRAGGTVRRNIRRDVDAECRDCGRSFPSTGTAASHTRATRHRVHVLYVAEFTFEPAGGAR